MADRGTHRALGLVVAALVAAADQASKFFVLGPLHLAERGEIVLLPVFRLLWVGNHGISMGLFTAQTPIGQWLLVAVTAAVAVTVLVWLWREQRRPDAMALGLVLGGAVGNIADRARLGQVVDFLNLHFTFGARDFSPFLVFNLADAAITIGVLLLVLRALLAPARPAKAEIL